MAEIRLAADRCALHDTGLAGNDRIVGFVDGVDGVFYVLSHTKTTNTFTEDLFVLAGTLGELYVNCCTSTVAR